MQVEAAPQGSRRAVNAIWLPAFAFVLGAQAWRAGAVLLADQPGPWRAGVGLATTIGLALVLHLPGPRLGSGRLATTYAIALGVLRILCQLGAPAGAAVYAIAGSALWIAYLSLWPRSAMARPYAVPAFLLACSLQLLDRVWTNTYDPLWQHGFGALVIVIVFSLPAVVVGADALVGAEREPWRGDPAPVAMPLAALLTVLVFGEPTAAAADLGWPLTRAMLLCGVAVLGGAGLTIALDQWHQVMVQRRPVRHWAIVAYNVVRTLLSVAVGIGLLFPGLRLAALSCGPAAVGVNLAALLRARPVGRTRRVAGWTLVLAWLGAAALTFTVRHDPWPLVVAMAVVYGFGSIALYHQERVPEEALTAAVVPLAGHVLVLVAVIATALFPIQGGRQFGRLAAPVFRIFAVDLTQPGYREDPSRIARLVPRLRAIRPQVVVIAGTRPRARLQFTDDAYWLARRLGLKLTCSAYGGPVVLAPTTGGMVFRSARQAASAWVVGETGVGLAVAVREGDQHVFESIATLPRRIVFGPVSPSRAAGEGYHPIRVGDLGRQSGLWSSSGIAVVNSAVVRDPVDQMPAVTALLDLAEPLVMER